MRIALCVSVPNTVLSTGTGKAIGSHWHSFKLIDAIGTGKSVPHSSDLPESSYKSTAWFSCSTPRVETIAKNGPLQVLCRLVRKFESEHTLEMTLEDFESKLNFASPLIHQESRTRPDSQPEDLTNMRRLFIISCDSPGVQDKARQPARRPH